VLLVDWTHLDAQHSALVAAVPTSGRSVPLYFEVHPRLWVGKRVVERRFLAALEEVVPTGVRPCIVADAGFRNPWFKALVRMGWPLVGRLTSRVLIARGTLPWERASNIYAQAGAAPQSLGRCRVAKTSPVELTVILSKKFTRNPLRSAAHRRATHRGRGQSAKNAARRAQEPWLLVTTLEDLSAREVVAIYARRMQIEETFRDAKNPRFGWSLSHARVSTQDRFTVLLLVVMLAFWTLLVLGKAAERVEMQRRFQANTVRHRRVFSLFFLAIQVLEHGDAAELTQEELLEAFETLFASLGV